MTQTLSAPIIESTVATTSFTVENCDGSDQYEWIYILESPPKANRREMVFISSKIKRSHQEFSKIMFSNN